MDYDALYRQLADAILKEGNRLDGDFSAFVERFLAELPTDHSSIPPDAQRLLTDWLTQTTDSIKPKIEDAIALGANAGSMTDAAIAELAQTVFAQRWPNGINLSQRLWDFRADVKTGIQQAIADGLRQMRGVGKITYDMQRAIEQASGGELFKIVQRAQEDWVMELADSALTLIHDPAARTQWVKTVADIRAHVNQLSQEGTRSAAERVVSQIAKAVKKANGDLVAGAVKWWVYDRQLYNLKRIARTEMANAAHLSIIESTIQDESIIGYQWRLSPSHPRPDICEVYANIDMGLGKGVFDKAHVPRAKAHPHCLCLLVPRVTPNRRASGEVSFDTLLAQIKPATRDFIFRQPS